MKQSMIIFSGLIAINLLAHATTSNATKRQQALYASEQKTLAQTRAAQKKSGASITAVSNAQSGSSFSLPEPTAATYMPQCAAITDEDTFTECQSHYTHCIAEYNTATNKSKAQATLNRCLDYANEYAQNALTLQDEPEAHNPLAEYTTAEEGLE